MPRRRPGTKVVRDAETLRALRTPVRQEILGTLERLGTGSVRDVAEQLGRKPASLYYHVHDMCRAGLVVEAGSRPRGRRMEKLYETVASRIVIEKKPRSKAFTEELKGLHRSALRAAEREMDDSLERNRRSGDRPDDVTSLLRLSARLCTQDARRVRRMLQDVARFMQERTSHRAARSYSLTISLARLPDRE